MLRLLDEPLAAALALIGDTPDALRPAKANVPRAVVVFNIGGGSCDACYREVDEGVLEVCPRLHLWSTVARCDRTCCHTAPAAGQGNSSQHCAQRGGLRCTPGALQTAVVRFNLKCMLQHVIASAIAGVPPGGTVRARHWRACSGFSQGGAASAPSRQQGQRAAVVLAGSARALCATLGLC